MQKMAFILCQGSQGDSYGSFSIEYALLAMQSALLREVTPELRAVVVDLDKDMNKYYVSVFTTMEKHLKEMIDLWDCAISEGSADLGPEFLLEAQIERLDYPPKKFLRAGIMHT